MCSSFTWGTVSVHYLLGLPLAYALRSATPNGLMLLVKLTYSPVMLRPMSWSIQPCDSTGHLWVCVAVPRQQVSSDIRCMILEQPNRYDLSWTLLY